MLVNNCHGSGVVLQVFVERLGEQYSECITDLDSVQPSVYSQIYGVNYSVNVCTNSYILCVSRKYYFHDHLFCLLV